jgi:hypothetical protein
MNGDKRSTGVSTPPLWPPGALSMRIFDKSYLLKTREFLNNQKKSIVSFGIRALNKRPSLSSLKW